MFSDGGSRFVHNAARQQIQHLLCLLAVYALHAVHEAGFNGSLNQGAKLLRKLAARVLECGNQLALRAVHHAVQRFAQHRVHSGPGNRFGELFNQRVPDRFRAGRVDAQLIGQHLPVGFGELHAVQNAGEEIRVCGCIHARANLVQRVGHGCNQLRGQILRPEFLRQPGEKLLLIGCQRFGNSAPQLAHVRSKRVLRSGNRRFILGNDLFFALFVFVRTFAEAGQRFRKRLFLLFRRCSHGVGILLRRVGDGGDHGALVAALAGRHHAPLLVAHRAHLTGQFGHLVAISDGSLVDRL